MKIAHMEVNENGAPELYDMAIVRIERNITHRQSVNPLTAKLFNWNSHPLEVVSR